MAPWLAPELKRTSELPKVSQLNFLVIDTSGIVLCNTPDSLLNRLRTNHLSFLFLCVLGISVGMEQMKFVLTSRLS